MPALHTSIHQATVKIPLQLMSSLDLPTTRILVGSRVRNASPAHTHQSIKQLLRYRCSWWAAGTCPQPGSWWGPGFDMPALHTHTNPSSNRQNATTVDGYIHHAVLVGPEFVPIKDQGKRLVMVAYFCSDFWPISAFNPGVTCSLVKILSMNFSMNR